MFEFEKILLVSSNGKGHMNLKSLLNENGVKGSMTSCFSCSKARQEILSVDFNLIIIDAPLNDENGIDLARSISQDSLSTVLLIVEERYIGDIATRVSKDGVLVLGKPIISPLLFQSLVLCNSLNVRLRGIANENRKLRRKLEEIKIVNRAKFLIIDRLKFDEQKAHRYIEKRAMDQRRSKGEIAKEILKTYQQ
ncbi:MAG: ANTAR domain-containing protein [Sphaerochaetaceae bacterium]|nr:ANTAR domain-containing protein [Sphaerochaetaceae bacterium]MDC7243281.1 ANTAR domain-containing protein [Sphaerochaetaceae bacterium]MDC7250183.1 ANTAR domain-containing protein [Sphaerochaetaceae bacterium]